MMLEVIKNRETLLQIAVKCKAIRKAAGLDQHTVAKATGINIGCIEAVQTNFKVKTLERLCRYYGVSLAEFFRDIEM